MNKRAFSFLKRWIVGLFRNKRANLDIPLQFTRKMRWFFYIFIGLYLVVSLTVLVWGSYLVIDLVANPVTIKTTVSLIVESVQSRNSGNIVETLNHSLFVFLPLLFFLLLGVNLGKSLFRRIRLSR